jgi:4-hydroxy-tetrahydrodipicolinate reductase
MGRSIFEAAAGQDLVQVETLLGPSEPEWRIDPARWLPELTPEVPPPDLLIDFSLPDGTRAAAEWCAERKVPLLSGVTGLPREVMRRLEQCATVVPVLWSPNLSIGVNLLADLASRAAAVLDPETPVTIDDLHHQWKKDAPSGTALMLGQRIAGRRNGDDSALEYRSRREGEVIGEHRIRFQLAGEEIELAHIAGDRGIYARGALDAGRWLLRQAPGLYTAADWLSGR